MTGISIALALLAMIVFLLAWVFFDNFETAWGVFFGILGGLLIVATFYTNGTDFRQREAEQGQQKLAARMARETPHVVKEVDGCKVYAFEHDRHTQFFVRCQNSTSTQSNWSERSGKTTQHKSSTIALENE